VRNSRGTVVTALDYRSRADTHPAHQRQEGREIHEAKGGGYPGGGPDPVRAQRPLPRKHLRQPHRQHPVPGW